MIECRRSSKLVEPGARTPPTEPLKSVSPVKTSVPFTMKLSIPRRVTGRQDGLDPEPADLERLPRLDRPVHVGELLRLDRVGEDLDAVALLPDGVLRHVVSVVVREQQQLHFETVTLGRFEQRPGRPARVDHHRLPVLLVPDEVSVGEPFRLH